MEPFHKCFLIYFTCHYYFWLRPKLVYFWQLSYIFIILEVECTLFFMWYLHSKLDMLRSPNIIEFSGVSSINVGSCIHSIFPDVLLHRNMWIGQTSHCVCISLGEVSEWLQNSTAPINFQIVKKYTTWIWNVTPQLHCTNRNHVQVYSHIRA